MLVKVHSYRYLEDFGLSINGSVYLYDYCVYGDDKGENQGPLKVSSSLISPVIRVNAVWMDKPIKVVCHIADTEDKKIMGLQGFTELYDNEGMYFPYNPYGESVTFHQGSVPFSLDLIFLNGDKVIRTEEHTKVGSSDRWTCDKCTGVIEVNSGFCRDNDIVKGDRLALFAVSERDLRVLDLEKEGSYTEDLFENLNAVDFVSYIADNL